MIIKPRFTYPLVLAAFGLLQTLFFATPAKASGDFGCPIYWKLKITEYDTCSSTAIISPANDTRVNMSLLFDDFYNFPPDKAQIKGVSLPYQTPAPFDWRDYVFTVTGEAGKNDEEQETNSNSIFSYGEGTRCVSDAQGQADFEENLNSNKQLSPEERAILIKARSEMKPSCDDSKNASPIVSSSIAQIQSETGKQYATYLSAAASFYDGDFDNAKSSFTSLITSKNKWLSETANYMIARVDLNKAQVKAFDEWGNIDLKNIDKNTLALAQNSLNSYIKNYPNGIYANSARGLLRRVYWFGGDKDKLLNEYVWQYKQTDPKFRSINNIELAQEIDTKILWNMENTKASDPIFTAIIDLYKMRQSQDTKPSDIIQLSEIEKQKPIFAQHQSLYEYLLAVHAFYVQKNPSLVLKLIPDAANSKNFTNLQYSRQMLRGLALEELNDRNSRGFWQSLFPASNGAYQKAELQLALAMYDERHNNLSKVFASDSLVENKIIRETLISNSADANLLRKIASDKNNKERERQLALHTLLFKELTRGSYSQFLNDLDIIPSVTTTAADPNDYNAIKLDVFKWQGSKGDFFCLPIADIAAQLAKTPNSQKPLMCLAEFVRLNYFDGYEDYTPPKDELGGSKTLFAGSKFSRLEIYKSVIADPNANPNLKAYALFRAINCYAPSRYNQCGGIDVPVEKRKEWFNILKSKYKTTIWAQKLQYYW